MTLAAGYHQNHVRARCWRLRIMLCSVAALTLAACGDPVVKKADPLAEIQRTQKLPVDSPVDDKKAYLIGIGDELEVKSFLVPEINDLVQVRPDGKISLMLAEDMQAAGKTAEELANNIKQKITVDNKNEGKPYIDKTSLDLVVVLRSFSSQKAYVSGEVGKPGEVKLNGEQNLMQVLSAAGWITPEGRRNEVVLMRCCEKEKKPKIYTIDVDKIVSGEDMAQNIQVHAGDQIMVPPSEAVAFDRWVDQYIRRALPFSTNVVFGRQWNNE